MELWNHCENPYPFVCAEVLDAAERLVAAHPEFELLSVRRSLVRSEDSD